MFEHQDREEYFEQLIASAATFLVDGGEFDAANVILSCRIEEIEHGSSSFSGDRTLSSGYIKLRGPRSALDIINDHKHQMYEPVHRALQASLPHDSWLEPLSARLELANVSHGWREDLAEIARGRSVANQASNAQHVKTWERLRFRSMSEVKIAQALDRAGVMFLPLCMVRLASPEGRVNREPDFLVCVEGKWGILEVDGEPFHPPQRATEDHERDRLFRNYGVRVVEHYDATKCFRDPDAIVAEFLGLVDRTS